MSVDLPLLMATLALLVVNGLFVAAEFALVKVRAAQLDAAVAQGSSSAGVAQGMLERLDRSLLAAQLGITCTSLALGAIGASAGASTLRPLLAGAGLAEGVVEAVSVVVGVAVVVLLHVVLGSVVPKSLAVARPVETAMVVALPMRAFQVVSTPALAAIDRVSSLLLSVAGLRPASTQSLSVPVEELRQIAIQSVAGGELTLDQGEMLSAVFTFSDRVAHEIMVPRPKVHGIDLQQPLEASLVQAVELGHSRYPLYDGDLDQVVGVLHLKDLLPHVLEGTPPGDLRALAREPLYVPAATSAQRLLQAFQRHHTHLALVLDEYGGVDGIITLEDVLEELVGDIQDEHDVEEASIEETDTGYVVDGSILVDEVAGLLGVPEEALESDATTLAGLLMERLERVPRLDDEVSLPEGWRARVSLAAHRTAERVELLRPEDAPSTG